jgi:hypothetical protein
MVTTSTCAAAHVRESLETDPPEPDRTPAGTRGQDADSRGRAPRSPHAVVEPATHAQEPHGVVGVQQEVEA